MRKNLGNHSKKIDWMKIPKVHEQLCTPDMIVMEYVPSEKLYDISDSKVNRKKVCEASDKFLRDTDNGQRVFPRGSTPR